MTGGLTASVGVGTSKLMAKIASDLDKPDGLVVVPPGTEQDLLDPLPVGRHPRGRPGHRRAPAKGGVHDRRRRSGRSPATSWCGSLGVSHGHGLFRLARADDDRAVVAEREAKSVSVEDTYDTDLVDRGPAGSDSSSARRAVSERLRKAELSGRTVTVKVRLHDFTTTPAPPRCRPDRRPALVSPARPRAAGRGRHDGRRTAARGRGVRARRLDPGGPLRRGGGRGRRCRRRRVGADHSPGSAGRADPRAAVGAGLNVEHTMYGPGWCGDRAWSGDGAVRDRRDRPRARTHVRTDDPALSARRTEPLDGP